MAILANACRALQRRALQSVDTTLRPASDKLLFTTNGSNNTRLLLGEEAEASPSITNTLWRV